MLLGTALIICIINANPVACCFSERRSKVGCIFSAYRLLVWMPESHWSTL